MLLTSLRAARPASILLSCSLTLLLAACSPVQDSWPEPAEADQAHTGIDTPSPDAGNATFAASGYTFEPGSPGRRVALPVRLDPDPNNARTIRAAYRRDEPYTRPTPREQREARVMVLAEADLLAKGGIPTYRGDGSASNPSAVKFVSAPGALTLDYIASPQLNSIDELPHALRVVVYHLSDRAELDRLAEHEDGIRKLLEGEYFDEAVKGVRKHHIQPDSSGQLLIDRPEGGRYVAVVAGYDAPHAGSSVYVTEYSLGQWDMPGETLAHRSKDMFSPLPLHLQAALGDVGMAVQDTGRIFGNMKRVTNLNRQQARHVAVQKTPFPVSLIYDPRLWR